MMCRRTRCFMFRYLRVRVIISARAPFFTPRPRSRYLQNVAANNFLSDALLLRFLSLLVFFFWDHTPAPTPPPPPPRRKSPRVEISRLHVVFVFPGRGFLRRRKKKKKLHILYTRLNGSTAYYFHKNLMEVNLSRFLFSSRFPYLFGTLQQRLIFL